MRTRKSGVRRKSARIRRVAKRALKKLDFAFSELGRIDKLHESHKITKKQHDRRSKALLKRLVRK